MPRANRVRPDGELVAVPDRGLFWGNRGPLLDRHGRVARHSSGRRWIICVLEFKGRRRVQWTPGRLTEIYFLDEATGLAAGHRPCGECRVAAHRAFSAAWQAAHPAEPHGVEAMDRRLQGERLVAPGRHRTYVDRLDRLPDGAMVQIEERPWLVRGAQLLAWTPGGYTERRPRPGPGPVSTGAGLARVTVLTPRPTVATLRAGYRPVLHPSAGEEEEP
jgi:hypothetical protein